MNCLALPGTSTHGILQTRTLEWVAISFSRESSWPRDQTHVSYIGRQILYDCDTWEALLNFTICLYKFRSLMNLPRMIPYFQESQKEALAAIL